MGSSRGPCYLPEVGEASGCAGRFFQQDRAESNARERERRDSNTQTHTHTQRKRATERVVEREAPHGEKAPSASSASCCCSRLTARASEQHTHWNQWRITEEAPLRDANLSCSPRPSAAPLYSPRGPPPSLIIVPPGIRAPLWSFGLSRPWLFTTRRLTSGAHAPEEQHPLVSLMAAGSLSGSLRSSWST